MRIPKQHRTVESTGLSGRQGGGRHFARAFSKRPTWDQALRHGLATRDRHRIGRALLAALLAVGLVVGLLPGVAFAHFDVPGLGGAQLDIPDTAVTGQGPFAVGATVPVNGRSFVANDKVLVFECRVGETDLLHKCLTVGAAMSDSNGAFSTQVPVEYAWVSPSGTPTTCQGGGLVPGSGSQCSVAAATYDTLLQQATSMADHYLCLFGFGFGDGCTTNRDGSPTTTTTLAPPPSHPWVSAAAMNVARQGLATAVGPDGRIYALGGSDAADPFGTGNTLKSAEVFDPCGKRMWQLIAPMPTARTEFAAATGPDGRIYAIGGRDANSSGTPLASVDAYDPATNTWSTVASMALPRADLGAATGPDGRIYAIGGKAASGAVPIVEAYDTATNQWQLVAPLPFPEGEVGAATGPDGRVYSVVGGYRPTGAPEGNAVVGPVESYAPGAAGTPGTWRKEASPAGGLPAAPAVTTGPDGLIYAIGGFEDLVGGLSLRSVWTFDTTTDTWTISQEALTSRRARNGVAAGKDGRIYAIGGLDYDPFAIDPPPPMVTTEAAQVAPSSCPKGAPPPADFTGDGKTDVSVFRPSEGTWYVKDGLSLGWGAQGDIPVPGDYDGDRKTDVAIFRPATGLWAIHGSAGTDTFVTYGIGSDTPVPADYDGDGKTDIAIYRPEYATWWIHQSSTGLDTATTYGIASDVPVPADYDGDGKADLGIFRAGTWFAHLATGIDTATNYGAPGDVPVTGDYDGDHTADMAVFRPSDGSWFLHHSSDNTDEAFSFGANGDVPQPGDYNGDGITDPALFRPSTGQWFIETGETFQWGIGTDIPLPLPYAVRASLP